jgi:hypothetical protein
MIAAMVTVAEALFIGSLLYGATFMEPLYGATTARERCSGSSVVPDRNNFGLGSLPRCPLDAWSRWQLRKLIAFDDDTLDKLTQLARDRMATFQELADEAFADLLKKHGIPIDLKDALRKSAGVSKTTVSKRTRSKPRGATS